MTPTEVRESQSRIDKIAAWYAAESIVLQAKRLMRGAGLILKDAEYPQHLEVYSALRNTIIALEVIVEHFGKGSPFEEKPKPRGE